MTQFSHLFAPLLDVNLLRMLVGRQFLSFKMWVSYIFPLFLHFKIWMSYISVCGQAVSAFQNVDVLYTYIYYDATPD